MIVSCELNARLLIFHRLYKTPEAPASLEQILEAVKTLADEELREEYALWLFSHNQDLGLQVR